MTKAQRATYAFTDAAELFNDDLDALAVALAGVRKKSGLKSNHANLKRDMERGIHEKHESAYIKIAAYGEDKIESCKAAALCRFADMEGQLECAASISHRIGEEMNDRHKQMEIATLDKMRFLIERIQFNLRRGIVQDGNRTATLPGMGE